MFLLNRCSLNVAVVIGAVIAAGLASLCCLGPLLYLVFGLSAAGLVGVPALAWLSMPMRLLSVGLFGVTGWRLYGSSRPVCVSLFGRRAMQVMFWWAVVIALALMTYPYVLPWLLEGMDG